MEYLTGFITDPAKIIEFPIAVAQLCVEYASLGMAMAGKIMRLVVRA